MFARPSSSRSLLSPGLPLSLFFLAPPRAPDAQYLPAAAVLLRPPPPPPPPSVPFITVSATNTVYRSLESNDCEESRHRRIAVTVYALSYIFRVHGTHTHAAAGRRTTNRSQHPACKRSDGSTTAVQSTALRSLLVQGKYRSITTQSRSIPSLPTLSVPLSPRQSSQTLAFHLFELHLPRCLINRRACDQLLLLLLLLLGRQVITD